MGKIFERELKGILKADEDVLRRVTKTCSYEEKAGYMRIQERPFMVIRGAGSLGIDIVAIRYGVSLPIEVKSSTSDVLRFSRSEKLAIQAEEMMEDCKRVGLMPIYAFRHKGQRGDAWRIFTLDIGPLNGRLKLIYNRLPKIAPSKEGNLIMRWKEGMPLSKFIDYVVELQS
ncbi:MAG TPA: Holliday junction resolvase [Thermoplasmata archaeon]|jgi:Holliday junction resolvase|nr:Holliday junction resolvase [Thermoplasmata archaeon]